MLPNRSSLRARRPRSSDDPRSTRVSRRPSPTPSNPLQRVRARRGRVPTGSPLRSPRCRRTACLDGLAAARSSELGVAPPVRWTTSRVARPIVRFARAPIESAPIVELNPSSSRIGPLTIRTCPGGDVVTACPWTLNAGSRTHSTAARTTGKYSGRHPARTAHEATRSSVASPIAGATGPSERSGGRSPSIRATASVVGGTTGSPSLQPRSNMSSRASAISACAAGDPCEASVARAPHPGFHRGSSAPRSTSSSCSSASASPALESLRDVAVAIDRHDRRNALDPVKLRYVPGRLLSEDGGLDRLGARQPRGRRRRFLCDDDKSCTRQPQARPMRAEPAQREACGGTVGVCEHEHDRARRLARRLSSERRTGRRVDRGQLKVGCSRQAQYIRVR